MLSPLIFIYFIIIIQIFNEESVALSQEILADPIEQAAQLQQQANKLIKESLDNNLLTQSFLGNQHSQKGCQTQGLEGRNNTTKGCIPSITPLISTKQNSGKILVFVSFSMPETSLKALARDAQQYNAVLVIRGLYQDSFAKTAQKLQELEVTIDINPELFEKHHISSVPAFVLLKDGHSIFNLKGNVTLNFVSKEFDNHLSKDQANFRRIS